MAIELIDKIKQKNGGTFKLVDSEDVAFNQHSVKEEIENANRILAEKANKSEIGSPLIASSISEMTDTTRVYVNTSDGHWYSYDGGKWVDGGIYQSQGIEDGTITPDKTDFVKSSYQYLNNVNITTGKYYWLNGSNVDVATNDGYKVFSKLNLKKGKYYFKDVIPVFSFLKNTGDNTVVKLEDVLINSGDKHFTINYNFDFYVTVLIDANEAMLTNVPLPTEYKVGAYDINIDGIKLKELKEDIINQQDEIDGLSARKELKENSVETEFIKDKQVTVEKTNFIQTVGGHTQYINKDEVVRGKYYWYNIDDNDVIIAEHNEYITVPPLTLQAGKYYFNSLGAEPFTYIKNLRTGEIVKLSTVADSITKTFEADFPFEIYLTYMAYDYDMMLTDGELPDKYFNGSYGYKNIDICGCDLVQIQDRIQTVGGHTQYIKKSELTNGNYYWFNEDENKVIVAEHNEYFVAPPLTLKPSKYYFNSLGAEPFTYVKNLTTGEIIKLSTVADSITKTFEADFPFELYMTYMVAYDSNVMFADGELPNQYFEGTYGYEEVSVYGCDLIKMQNDIENLKHSGTGTASYNSLHDDEINNLFNAFDGFNANVIDGNSVDTTGSYQGLITNEFRATTNNLTLKFEGVSTCSKVTVLIVYFDGTDWIYSGVLEISSPQTLNQKLVLDASNYTVYHNAQKFKFLIMNGSDTSGSITINSITIEDLDELRSNAMYDKNFVEMTKKTFQQINENQSNINRLDLKIPSLVDANGKKYTLSVGTDGSLSAVPNIPNKVLVMGNSLVFGLGEYNGGAFGMCASDSMKDFYTYVKNAILEKNPSASFNREKIAQFEQCESDEASLSELNRIKNSFTSDLDLIIIQIGDNVNTDLRREVFSRNFSELISSARTYSQKARIICVGIWYPSITEVNNPKDIIIDNCKKYGCEFVDISYLHTPDNEATIGDTITYNDGSTELVPDGWNTHPGNSGMKLIADEIISAINM